MTLHGMIPRAHQMKVDILQALEYHYTIMIDK
jgi:hypothetical protein